MRNRLSRLLIVSLLMPASQLYANEWSFDVYLDDKKVGTHLFEVVDAEEQLHVQSIANFKLKMNPGAASLGRTLDLTLSTRRRSTSSLATDRKRTPKRSSSSFGNLAEQTTLAVSEYFCPPFLISYKLS